MNKLSLKRTNRTSFKNRFSDRRSYIPKASDFLFTYWHHIILETLDIVCESSGDMWEISNTKLFRVTRETYLTLQYLREFVRTSIVIWSTRYYIIIMVVKNGKDAFIKLLLLIISSNGYSMYWFRKTTNNNLYQTLYCSSVDKLEYQNCNICH